MWLTSRRGNQDVHVTPIDDLREHVETQMCWCKPTIEKKPHYKVAIVIHNSMDGRELVEKHGVN